MFLVGMVCTYSSTIWSLILFNFSLVFEIFINYKKMSDILKTKGNKANRLMNMPHIYVANSH